MVRKYKSRNAPPSQRRSVNLSANGNKHLAALKDMLEARWNRTSQASMSLIFEVALEQFYKACKGSETRLAQAVEEMKKAAYPVKPTPAVRKLAKKYAETVQAIEAGQQAVS